MIITNAKSFNNIMATHYNYSTTADKSSMITLKNLTIMSNSDRSKTEGKKYKLPLTPVNPDKLSNVSFMKALN